MGRINWIRHLRLDRFVLLNLKDKLIQMVVSSFPLYTSIQFSGYLSLTYFLYILVTLLTNLLVKDITALSSFPLLLVIRICSLTTHMWCHLFLASSPCINKEHSTIVMVCSTFIKLFIPHIFKKNIICFFLVRFGIAHTIAENDLKQAIVE